MKRGLALLAITMVIGGCSVIPPMREKMVLDDSTTIVIGREAPTVVRFAAEELRTYLKRIGNAELSIATDDQLVTGRRILVGRSSATDELGMPTEFEPDSFIIKTIGDDVILMGDDRDVDVRPSGDKMIPFNHWTSRKGSLYAVYTLLERFLGVRWLWPGESGEVIPKMASLALPAPINIDEKPDFLWRHFYFYGSKDYPPEVWHWELPLWYMRNKLGVTIGSPYSFAHSWGSRLKNNLFAAHPEYYSLVDGERRPFRENAKGRPYGRQVCTSNPEVVELFARRTCENRDPEDDAIVSISPNDGLDFCECPHCRSLDHPELYGPKEGYRGEVLSDRIYGFVNQVAEKVAETHPNLRLGIFSYTVVRPVPRALDALADNVTLSMTQTNAYYRDPERKKRNRARLAEWNAKGGSYVGRDYLGNYSFAAVMHPQTEILAEDLRYMRDHGYIGYYTEADVSFATQFLNYHVLAKLMWNADIDVDAVIEDFCRKGFGPAADKMREFLAIMEESYMNSPSTGIHPSDIPDWYSPGTLRRCGELLHQAEELAETKKQKERVRYVAMGLDYTEKVVRLLRLYKQLNDAGLPVDLYNYEPDQSGKTAAGDVAKLIEEARAAGAAVSTALDAHRGTTRVQPYPFERMNQVKRWFKTVDDYARLYGDSSDGRVVTTLPDVWKFKTDPNDVGVREQWFQTAYDDGDWAKIRIDKTWEKQGYEGYDGYAWYRLDHVEIPDKTIAGDYSLRLGAVDESCWVYVNGALVGKAMFDPENDPDGWKKPRVFPITKHLKSGKENIIAVRVHDRKYAGGIWRKAYLIHDRTTAGKNVFLEDFKNHPKRGGASENVKNARVSLEPSDNEGDQCLRVSVDKPFPSGYSLTIPRIPLEGDQRYVASMRFKSEKVKPNESEKKHWLKRPRLPNLRIIFLDSSGKPCGPASEYVWFGAPFKTSTNGWELVKRIFKTPPDAKFARLTVFLQANGIYWLDDVSVDKL